MLSELQISQREFSHRMSREIHKNLFVALWHCTFQYNYFLPCVMYGCVSFFQIASLKKQVAQKEQSLLDKDKQVGYFFLLAKVYIQ